MVKDFIFFMGFQMIDRRVNERRIFALMVCFIFLFVGWFSTAKADQWTVLGGFSKFQVHDDGVWYQEAFPYNFKLTPPSVGLRLPMDCMKLKDTSGFSPDDAHGGWSSLACKSAVRRSGKFS